MGLHQRLQRGSAARYDKTIYIYIFIFTYFCILMFLCIMYGHLTTISSLLEGALLFRVPKKGPEFRKLTICVYTHTHALFLFVGLVLGPLWGLG